MQSPEDASSMKVVLISLLTHRKQNIERF